MLRKEIAARPVQAAVEDQQLAAPASPPVAEAGGAHLKADLDLRRHLVLVAGDLRHLELPVAVGVEQDEEALRILRASSARVRAPSPSRSAAANQVPTLSALGPGRAERLAHRAEEQAAARPGRRDGLGGKRCGSGQDQQREEETHGAVMGQERSADKLSAPQ